MSRRPGRPVRPGRPLLASLHMLELAMRFYATRDTKKHKIQLKCQFYAVYTGSFMYFFNILTIKTY